MKLKISNEELCRECPEEFLLYMDHVKNLEFQEAPDYAYCRSLFTKLAAREEIELDDDLFDWNVRAMTIKNHPNFFDFIKNQEVHPFDRRGRFLEKYRVEDRTEELSIYREAR